MLYRLFVSKTRYNLDLVFANVFFGANFSFYVSLTRNYLDFQQIFMLQVLSAAIFFIPFALFSKQSFRITWRDAGNILIVTLLIVYGWMYMLLWGSSYTTPIDASIIATLGPAFTLIMDHLMHPHKYIRARVVGVVCALVGPPSCFSATDSRSPTAAGRRATCSCSSPWWPSPSIR